MSFWMITSDVWSSIFIFPVDQLGRLPSAGK